MGTNMKQKLQTKTNRLVSSNLLIIVVIKSYWLPKLTRRIFFSGRASYFNFKYSSKICYFSLEKSLRFLITVAVAPPSLLNVTPLRVSIQWLTWQYFYSQRVGSHEQYVRIGSIRSSSSCCGGSNGIIIMRPVIATEYVPDAK